MSVATLYERLGEGEGVRKIVDAAWELHLVNDKIKRRYIDSDGEKVKQSVWEFFCSGIGGPQTYSGEDMVATHRGMNINDEEFNALVDDVMKAMDQCSCEKTEKDEVLCILWSMKDEVNYQ